MLASECRVGNNCPFALILTNPENGFVHGRKCKVTRTFCEDMGALRTGEFELISTHCWSWSVLSRDTVIFLQQTTEEDPDEGIKDLVDICLKKIVSCEANLIRVSEAGHGPSNLNELRHNKIRFREVEFLSLPTQVLVFLFLSVHPSGHVFLTLGAQSLAVQDFAPNLLIDFNGALHRPLGLCDTGCATCAAVPAPHMFPQRERGCDACKTSPL